MSAVSAPGFAASGRTVLEVSGLTVAFPRPGGTRQVVAGIGYTLAPGRTLGVVGESGCGKSMTALALMGLVPEPGRVAGSIRFEGQEMLGQAAAVWRERARRPRRDGVPGADDRAEPGDDGRPPDRRGAGAAQGRWSWRDAERRAVDMLAAVGITSPEQRAARLSAPAFRRHAPARDDRHGAGLRARLADRRRADHGARRHDPGADPRPDAGAAGRDRHGDPVHQPQPRGGRPRSRTRSSSCMPAASSSARRPTLLFADPLPPLHARPDRDAAGSRRGASTALPVIPGGVPDLDARDPAAASPIAARGPTRGCRAGEPPTGGGRARPFRRLLQGARMSELVALDRISVHFPLGGGGCSAGRRASCGRRTGQLRHRRGRDPRAGRRKRQRQEHARQRRRRACRCRPRARCAFAASRWTGRPGRPRAATIQIVFQDPFGALDPRMPVSAIIAEPLLIQRIGSTAAAPRARRRSGRAGRPAARRAEPLPARILRRPAPAHRHRPRAGARIRR